MVGTSRASTGHAIRIDPRAMLVVIEGDIDGAADVPAIEIARACFDAGLRCTWEAIGADCYRLTLSTKTSRMADAVHHTAHENGVDFDGVSTVADVRRALADAGLLDSRALGDGGADPTIREWLDSLDDAITLYR